MKTQAIESRQTAMRIARRTSYVDVVTVEEATHGQPQADFSEPPPGIWPFLMRSDLKIVRFKASRVDSTLCTDGKSAGRNVV